MTYLEELRQHGVCRIQSAANQHSAGEIEICDGFWPYEKVRSSTKTDTVAGYIEQARRLLGARRCVGSAFTPADERLAAALFERKVLIEEVEHAVLLGCARKYVALINHQSRDSIVSFSYFQNVIEEVRELKMSAEYWRHLQMRVDRLEQQWAQMKAAAAEARSLVMDSLPKPPPGSMALRLRLPAAASPVWYSRENGPRKVHAEPTELFVATVFSQVRTELRYRPLRIH